MKDISKFIEELEYPYGVFLDLTGEKPSGSKEMVKRKEDGANVTILSISLPNIDEKVTIAEAKRIVYDIIDKARPAVIGLDITKALVPSNGYPIKFMWTLIGELLSEDVSVYDEAGEEYTNYYNRGWSDAQRDW